MLWPDSAVTVAGSANNGTVERVHPKLDGEVRTELAELQ